MKMREIHLSLGYISHTYPICLPPKGYLNRNERPDCTPLEGYLREDEDPAPICELLRFQDTIWSRPGDKSKPDTGNATMTCLFLLVCCHHLTVLHAELIHRYPCVSKLTGTWMSWLRKNSFVLNL